MKAVSTVDLMPLSWNFSIGCLHLDLRIAYIKLWSYVKRTLKENELKQQVATRVWIITLSFSSRVPSQKQQPRSFSTSSPSSQSALCISSCWHIWSRPALLHVPASTLTGVDLTRPCCHTLYGPDCSAGTPWTLHFITLVFYWLEMFFCLSNREINCPSLALTVHLIFCSMFWSALEKGPVAIKKPTALRSVSGEIYCNNQIVSGHGRGSYIWKYAMVIMIIGLLYTHWRWA